MTNKTILLINMEKGQHGRVVSITGGRIAVKRLADMGLTINSKVKLVRKAMFHGPVEVEVISSRLVIGRGLASKIMVELNG